MGVVLCGISGCGLEENSVVEVIIDKQSIGTVIDAQTVFSPHLQQHWCTRHS